MQGNPATVFLSSSFASFFLRELDSRDVTILYQYARVLLHHYRHRAKEALDLIDRALVECTYTRETGPLRGRGDIDFERDEENNHVFLEEGNEKEEERGEGKEDLEDEDHRERETPRNEELLLHLCSFSADLLHALRGEALLELWRQKSQTVYVHLTCPSKGCAADIPLDSCRTSSTFFSFCLSLIYLSFFLSSASFMSPFNHTYIDTPTFHLSIY